jgi:hypothetical protein
MVDLEETYNFLAIPYSISLAFIGAFFLLNLTLAVINSKFNEAHKKQEEEKRLKRISKFHKNLYLHNFDPNKKENLR